MNSTIRAACAAIAFAAIVAPLLSQGAYALDSLPAGVTMFTEEKRYVAGETVRLVAQLHEHAISNTLALFTVYAPDDETFLVSKQTIQGNMLNFIFSIDKDETRTGEWTVNVRYSDINENATFTLLDKGLYDKAVLNSPVLRDGRGAELAPESIRAGTEMVITAGLENDEEESRPYVFAVQVLDEDGMPALVSLMTGNMSPGQTANPSINWKPAESGTYTVEVFAWSSLANPVPLDDKRAGTFEVY